jgi:homocysteine S-methyltransferase
MEYFDRFFELFGGPSPIPLLVGVWPIRSLELAVRVHNETPGIVVPEHVQERYRDAGANEPQVGIDLVHELIEQSREVAAGVYIVAPFRRPLGILDVL